MPRRPAALLDIRVSAAGHPFPCIASVIKPSEHGGVIVEEEISTLTAAIAQLETELKRAPPEARRAEIAELLQTVKAMRVAIIAKEGVSTLSNKSPGT